MSVEFNVWIDSPAGLAVRDEMREAISCMEHQFEMELGRIINIKCENIWGINKAIVEVARVAFEAGQATAKQKGGE